MPFRNKSHKEHKNKGVTDEKQTLIKRARDLAPSVNVEFDTLLKDNSLAKGDIAYWKGKVAILEQMSEMRRRIMAPPEEKEREQKEPELRIPELRVPRQNNEMKEFNFPIHNGKLTQQQINAIPANLTTTEWSVSFSFSDSKNDDPKSKHLSYDKRNPRRLVDVLLNSLNERLDKYANSYGYDSLESINITLTKRVNQRIPMKGIKENLEVNCVIDCIILKQKHTKNFKNVLPYLKKLNTIIFETGMTEEYLEEIAKKFKYDIACFSSIQEVWFQNKNFDKYNYPKILLCIQNNHATVMEGTFKRQVDVERLIGKTDPSKLNVTYVDDVEAEFLKQPTLVYPRCVGRSIRAIYDQKMNLIKDKSIFADDIDFELSHKNPEYFHLTTRQARIAYDFKKKFNIQSKWWSEELYEFVQSSDRHSKPWCLPEYHRGFAKDMSAAYLNSPKNCHLYEQYKFPRLPTLYYRANSPSKEHTQLILSKSGFVQVNNVNIPDTPSLECIRVQKEIQNNCVYAAPWLVFCMSLGITFDITAFAFSHDNQDLDFTYVPSDDEVLQLAQQEENWHISDNIKEILKSKIKKNLTKKYSLGTIGSLIYNRDNKFIRAAHDASVDGFLQLRYQLRNCIESVNFEKQIIYYFADSTDNQEYKGSPHVHSYVLCYQKIVFYQALMSVPWNQVLKIKVDSITLQTPLTELDPQKKSPLHNSDIWHDEEVFPKQVQYLDQVDFTHEEFDSTDSEAPFFNFDQEDGDCILRSKYIDVSGYGGCGKSTMVMNMNLPDLVVVVPQHILKSNFAKYPNVEVRTMHSVFGWGMKADPNNPTKLVSFHDSTRKLKRYSNILFDDAGMGACKGFFDNCLSSDVAKDCNIIISHDHHQLWSALPNDADWYNSYKKYFTNSVQYQNKTWLKIIKTICYRCKDQELFRRQVLVAHIGDKLDSLLDIFDSNKKPTPEQLNTFITESNLTGATAEETQFWREQIKSISIVNRQTVKQVSLKMCIYVFRDRIISEEDVLEKYKYDNTDLVVASTNSENNPEIDYWNKKLYNPHSLKAQYTRRIQKTKRNDVEHNIGDRLIMQKQQEKSQKLAYASSINAVQGRTFHDNLFLSLSIEKVGGNFDSHLFYTFITRPEYLNQIYLIQFDRH